MRGMREEQGEWTRASISPGSWRIQNAIGKVNSTFFCSTNRCNVVGRERVLFLDAVKDSSGHLPSDSTSISIPQGQAAAGQHLQKKHHFLSGGPFLVEEHSFAH